MRFKWSSQKNGIAAVIFAAAFVCAGRTDKYVGTGGSGRTGEYHYADPSSFAIPLYGINADSLESVKKNPSSFLEFAKNGAAIWHFKAPAAGLYSLRLLYACDDPGITIRVATDEGAYDFGLQGTQGYYRVTDRTIPRGALWPHGIGATPMQNYNRLDLDKNIPLRQGENNVTLRVSVPSGHAPFYLRSLEFLPLKDVEAAHKEWLQARARRSDPGWLVHAGYGLMFHWDNDARQPVGPSLSYADAVRAFNVQAFADMVQRAGAHYVIFTANHGGTNFPAPLKEWEAVHPGGTTKRDLIADMADALNARGIKLMIYLHVQILADPRIDPHFKDHYSRMSVQAFSRSAIRMLTAIGNRYGRRIAGYWFDSFLDIDTQYPDFPYRRFDEAAKAGNPDRLVATTNWIYPIDTEWQDYWGGELFVPGNPPSTLPLSDGPAKGLPFHALITLFGDWVHTKDRPMEPPVYSVEELGRFINDTKGKGAVTINTGIFQDGTIGKVQAKYLAALRKYVYEK